MITSCTFIPSQRVKDLLCALWVEYGCQTLAPRGILLELRAELGPADFALLEKDLARLLRRYDARRAVAQIIFAAVKRNTTLQTTSWFTAQEIITEALKRTLNT
ncbi:MAG: hypothetical protein ACJ71W_00765 [Terriglobales bacterium]